MKLFISLFVVFNFFTRNTHAQERANLDQIPAYLEGTETQLSAEKLSELKSYPVEWKTVLRDFQRDLKTTKNVSDLCAIIKQIDQILENKKNSSLVSFVLRRFRTIDQILSDHQIALRHRIQFLSKSMSFSAKLLENNSINFNRAQFGINYFEFLFELSKEFLDPELEEMIFQKALIYLDWDLYHDEQKYTYADQIVSVFEMIQEIHQNSPQKETLLRLPTLREKSFRILDSLVLKELVVTITPLEKTKKRFPVDTFVYTNGTTDKMPIALVRKVLNVKQIEVQFTRGQKFPVSENEDWYPLTKVNVSILTPQVVLPVHLRGKKIFRFHLWGPDRGHVQLIVDPVCFENGICYLAPPKKHDPKDREERYFVSSKPSKGRIEDSWAPDDSDLCTSTIGDPAFSHWDTLDYEIECSKLGAKEGEWRTFKESPGYIRGLAKIESCFSNDMVFAGIYTPAEANPDLDLKKRFKRELPRGLRLDELRVISEAFDRPR
jgi:hypothetical protein